MRVLLQSGVTMCLLFFGTCVITAETSIIFDVVPHQLQMATAIVNGLCNIFLVAAMVVLTWKFPR